MSGIGLLSRHNSPNLQCECDAKEISIHPGTVQVCSQKRLQLLSPTNNQSGLWNQNGNVGCELKGIPLSDDRHLANLGVLPFATASPYIVCRVMTLTPFQGPLYYAGLPLSSPSCWCCARRGKGPPSGAGQ